MALCLSKCIPQSCSSSHREPPYLPGVGLARLTSTLLSRANAIPRAPGSNKMQPAIKPAKMATPKKMGRRTESRRVSSPVR
ncbi:hypothetical protein ZHAS_00015695 [Anopheles sinensis]|uniref:Uncharacterized protein n=1 Tax=Anopheles sinensis TaxID=74873 RepID=A0A084WBQ8_ANOSI|nr:hypothetical protein ZHAS_00015695 [Anopheles sinensis]